MSDLRKHANPQPHHHGNGERFRPNPGEYDSATCGICGTEMEVTRSVNGPTCWAESASGNAHFHDSFACPYLDEDWHIQVRRIGEEARKSSSKALEKLLLKEAKRILATRKATKKVSKYL